jgi:hypothetical protein
MVASITPGKICLMKAQEAVDTPEALRVDTFCKANLDQVTPLLVERVRADASAAQLVIIDARDGKISLASGQTRYFALPPDADYGQSEVFYWHAAGQDHEFRLEGAT